MMTHNNKNSSEIAIDPKSGISVEEQREILAKINKIAEKNRLSLAAGGQDEGKDKKPRFKAMKSGRAFPVIVNIIAFAALAGGLTILSSMQGKTDAQARTGTKIYNSVERALIEEIRKETISLLAAKEREISLIISKLEEIDAEMFGLSPDSREFTSEEQAVRNRLKALQEEYLSTLAVLQDERSQILENAREREAFIQAQFASRTRELAIDDSQQKAANGELERLNMEQTQAAVVEAQIGAFFANLNKQITNNNFDEAGSTIRAMRNFINTPAFGALRSIQARKELYVQAINSFETMIDENRKYQAALNPDNPGTNPLSDFQARIVQLEQSLAEKDKTIEALGSEGSGASRRLNEIQKANSALQTEYRQLERTNSALQTRNSQLTADLDRQIQSATALQQSVNTLQQSVNTLQTENAGLTQTVAARDNTIANRNDVINRIRNEVEADKDLEQIPLVEIKAIMTRIQNALRSLQ
jgi:DNA-binding transcriptional ArsR family regulator